MQKMCKKWIVGYLILYFFILFAYCSVNLPEPICEWDDYTLPIASILYEHNLSITENDIDAYKKLFPEWIEYVDSYALSGRFTRNGGEMSWYFPVYSIVCIPLIFT